jgi:hypothetical protein
MTFADTGRTDQEHVPALSDKVSGSQFIDLSPIGIRIKTEVEVLQGAYFTEVG